MGSLLLLFRKFFPAFTALIIFVFSLLAVFLLSYSFIYFFVFSGFTIFTSLLLSLLILDKEVKKHWPLSLFLAILVSAAIGFLIFIQHDSLKIFFILILALSSYLLLETIFRFFYEPRKYPPYALENISFSLSFLEAFLIFSVLGGLIGYFNFSILYSLIIIFLATAILSLFVFWIMKISVEQKHILVFSLVMAELFYAMTFLPTTFYVNGLILTILFFVSINLMMREKKDGLLARAVIKKHVLLTILALTVTCLLAKWR